ncbi:molybdate ABC transporter substrate-binding protein [Zophobihabitans entericus]|uniref:Molybdate ABC transporter substrate-binding protein n=1 Tax=Zophobihabitans entericus TaxID=1635327 RepID=A0A6G9ID31_9GAMM|nr:molybdate ABC transporter substrate-binding protein [Zophobihabitans entericus]QIQ21747.1 molybdate ABC transporter substrate-binding protein [Zophobihabitans entericus]
MKKLIGIIAVLFCLNVNAEQKVTVFAAASLTNAMEDIGKLYEQQNQDTKIVFSFASSSTLARQIEQGAPVDIFMSADQKWMDYLIEKNIVKQKETLLKNSLVLITAADSTLTDVTINKQTDWSQLLPTGERLAVGDPDHVPAGLYAKESLTNLGVYSKLEPQLARANNVRAALTLVELQETPIGIVYSTDAKVSNKVKIIGEFPADTFASIEYPVALLNKDAEGFYNFLQTDLAKAVFDQYGFVTQ